MNVGQDRSIVHSMPHEAKVSIMPPGPRHVCLRGPCWSVMHLQVTSPMPVDSRPQEAQQTCLLDVYAGLDKSGWASCAFIYRYPKLSLCNSCASKSKS
eukprot:2054417-Amphidinium_carterae.1